MSSVVSQPTSARLGAPGDLWPGPAAAFLAGMGHGWLLRNVRAGGEDGRDGVCPILGNIPGVVVTLCCVVPSLGTTSISGAGQPGSLCPGTGAARHPSTEDCMMTASVPDMGWAGDAQREAWERQDLHALVSAQPDSPRAAGQATPQPFGTATGYPHPKGETLKAAEPLSTGGGSRGCVVPVC